MPISFTGIILVLVVLALVVSHLRGPGLRKLVIVGAVLAAPLLLFRLVAHRPPALAGFDAAPPPARDPWQRFSSAAERLAARIEQRIEAQIEGRRAPPLPQPTPDLSRLTPPGVMFEIYFRDARLAEHRVDAAEVANLVRGLLKYVAVAPDPAAIDLVALNELALAERPGGTLRLADCARVERRRPGGPRDTGRDEAVIVRLVSQQLDLEDIAHDLQDQRDAQPSQRALQLQALDEQRLQLVVNRARYLARLIDQGFQPEPVALAAAAAALEAQPAAEAALPEQADPPQAPKTPLEAEAPVQAEAAQPAVAAAAAPGDAPRQAEEIVEIEGQRPGRALRDRSVSTAEGPPAWIKSPPQPRDNVFYITGSDGPWATVAECQQQIMPLAVRLANEYARAHVGRANAQRVELTSADLEQMEALESYIEPVESPSLGRMYQAHVLLRFDPNDRHLIVRKWNQALIARRIVLLSGGAACVLALVAAAFAYLKLDTATKGYHSRQLLVAAGAAVLVVFSATMMLLGSL